MVASQQSVILLSPNERFQIGVDPITQRFEMTAERLDVAFGQVIGPAFRLVLLYVGQIAKEKLFGHQDAAEHLSRNRTGFQIELSHQSPVMLGEQRLTSSSSGDQAVPKVGCDNFSDCIFTNTPHPRFDCAFCGVLARPRR